MKLDGPGVVVIDRTENEGIYWSPQVYPEWAELNLIRLFQDQPAGQGVEPHFHDGDEYSLFVTTIGRSLARGYESPRSAQYGVLYACWHASSPPDVRSSFCCCRGGRA